MMTEHVLYSGGGVGLLRYDHPRDCAHSDPSEEVSTWHAVSFIERGRFDLFHGRRRWRIDAATLFVTEPGFAYRCEHDDAHPDDVSLSLHFEPEAVESIALAIGRRPPLGRPVARRTNRLAYLRHRLLAAACGPEAATAVPAVAGEILTALGDAGQDGNTQAPLSEGHISRYARRVDAARALYAARHAEPLSLEETALAVGMSPFHFSRVFRALVGVPPHRYLRTVRLSQAAARLRAGAGVTDTCQAVGFNNLSHFIRTFHAAYGVPPSRVRQSKKPQARPATRV